MKLKIKRMRSAKRWACVTAGGALGRVRVLKRDIVVWPPERIARVLVTEIVPNRRRK